MPPSIKTPGLLNLPAELHKRKRIILGELKERTLWFVKLRWFVPPSILIGTGLAGWLGIQLRASALLFVAVFIFAYNTVFYFLSRRVKREPNQKEFVQRFTYWQVGFDYGAMFLHSFHGWHRQSVHFLFHLSHYLFRNLLAKPYNL